jgi:hypothetical protein
MKPRRPAQPKLPAHKPADNDNDDPPAVPMPQAIPLPMPVHEPLPRHGGREAGTENVTRR